MYLILFPKRLGWMSLLAIWFEDKVTKVVALKQKAGWPWLGMHERGPRHG